jgi:hypothetical protein
MLCDDEESVVEKRNMILEPKIEVENSDDGPSSEDEYVDFKLGNKSHQIGYVPFSLKSFLFVPIYLSSSHSQTYLTCEEK